MARKLAITTLILRLIQVTLGLVFLLTWSWLAAIKYPLGGGGAGLVALGYISCLASLAVSGYGVWVFVKKYYLEAHKPIYYLGRMVADLGMVILWLAVILIGLLVPFDFPSQSTFSRNFRGPYSPDALFVTVGVAQLFSAITFMMASILMCIEGFRGRKSAKQATAPADVEEGNAK